MRFATREDIEVNVADVWAIMTDFEQFERLAIRRGARVNRIATGENPEWKVAFQFKGRKREAMVRLDQQDRPSLLKFSADGKALGAMMQLDLVALGPKRTRIAVVAEVKPKTLAARLFVQSLKLARGRINKRFNSRVSELAKHIETLAQERTARS